MKRADLKTGQDYLWDRHTDWLKSGYSSSRVTVLDTQAWDSPRNYFDRVATDVTLPDGRVYTVKGAARQGATGVLVYIADEQRAQVVPIAQLRGEWHAARIEQEQAQKAAMERSDRVATLRKQQADRVAQIRERLTALGFTEYISTNGGAVNGVNAATLEALLDIAEARDKT